MSQVGRVGLAVSSARKHGSGEGAGRDRTTAPSAAGTPFAGALFVELLLASLLLAAPLLAGPSAALTFNAVTATATQNMDIADLFRLIEGTPFFCAHRGVGNRAGVAKD